MSTTAAPQALMVGIEPILGPVEDAGDRESVSRDQVVAMWGVGWGGYEELLEVRGERARPRLLYLDGDLFLMSPGHSHERDKDGFQMFDRRDSSRPEDGRFRCIWPDRRPIGDARKKEASNPINPSTSPTRPMLLARRRSTWTSILRPISRSRSSTATRPTPPIEVSQRFGIPEVWVCDERGLTIPRAGTGRQVTRNRQRADRSPCLTASEILSWVRHPDEGCEFTDLDWMQSR